MRERSESESWSENRSTALNGNDRSVRVSQSRDEELLLGAKELVMSCDDKGTIGEAGVM